MTAAATVAVIVLLIAATLTSRRPRWRRLGYVERVGFVDPLPAMTAEERRERWRIAYDRLPIERKIDPGSAWPFVASAVSGLHRDLRCDPASMLAGR